MDKITQDVFFERNDLTIKESLFGTRFYVKGCRLEGEPGAPAFPVKKIKIALPVRTKPVKIKEKIVGKTLITQSKTFAACIQPREDPFRHYDNSEYKSDLKATMPDAELYQQAMTGKNRLARMSEPLLVGNIPVVTVEVSPLQYAKDGTIEFVDHILLEITLKKDEKAYIKPQLTSLQRHKEHSLVHELVINPELVRKSPLKSKKIKAIGDIISGPVGLIPGKFTLADKIVHIPKRVDYLIITDNDKWDAETSTTTGAAGDLVSEFNRLAAHKKNRGYRTYVARVHDIVAGHYGDFTTGARDLQEVLRNFLRLFVGQKGVEWVLLGGDVSIIPPRLACASAWGRVYKGTVDEENQSEWKGSYLGMQVNKAELGDSTHTLTNLDTGEVIPFDATGNSNATTPGWYHTTSKNFNTRTAAKTKWIRINGPAALTNAAMAWYTPTNMIPTDMYYSSLYSPLYNRPGRHDWDLLNNGLYGQHNETDISLGGADFSVDVGIGRAPVESTSQAKTFVDKVIKYDNWGEEHHIAAYNRFKKMLYVAEHWARYYHTITQQTGNTMPPGDRRFSSNATGGYALIHDTALPKEGAGNKIICHYSDTSRKELRYDMDADNGTPGWYYAKSHNNLSPSYLEISILFFSIKIPVATQWVVVYGPNPDITPMMYGIDKEGTDSSVLQQEELREWMRSNFSRINQVQRLYSDETDMPVGSWAGAGLKHLTTENLREELNSGHHFVSLTGHGNWTGVAHLDHGMINSLTNGDKTFIAIADSCLTNKFDVNDAIGESLLLHPGGGAVAYIGNSRYSWIGLGDDFRLQFFKGMKYSRNLANLNDSRCLFRNDVSDRLYKLWTILEQTLMGDPEMNVYRTDLDAYPKYIGNKNTMELHHSTCQWVKRMATWNMRYYDSIEEGINLGYDGCAFCLKSYDHG